MSYLFSDAISKLSMGSLIQEMASTQKAKEALLLLYCCLSSLVPRHSYQERIMRAWEQQLLIYKELSNYLNPKEAYKCFLFLKFVNYYYNYNLRTPKNKVSSRGEKTFSTKGEQVYLYIYISHQGREGEREGQIDRQTEIS